MKGKQEISIKVNIADAIYPLKIAADEEENVRKASKMINDKIRKFREDYHIEDKQVLLSMCILQFATELLLYKDKPMIKDEGISEKIMQIDVMLEQALKEI